MGKLLKSLLLTIICLCAIDVSAQASRKLVLDTSNGAKYTVVDAATMSTDIKSDGDMMEVGTSWVLQAKKGSEFSTEVLLNGVQMKKNHFLPISMNSPLKQAMAIWS